jgi:hypothetical protein
MDYALIGKIEKAKIYASEPERFQFTGLNVQLSGDNGTVHSVAFDNGKWACDCNFFGTRGFCSHTMAIERVLGDMLPDPAMA